MFATRRPAPAELGGGPLVRVRSGHACEMLMLSRVFGTTLIALFAVVLAGCRAADSGAGGDRSWPRQRILLFRHLCGHMDASRFGGRRESTAWPHNRSDLGCPHPPLPSRFCRASAGLLSRLQGAIVWSRRTIETRGQFGLCRPHTSSDRRTRQTS